MKKNSLSNKAYTEIRTKILSSQLPSNTRLKEDLWAQKLDVSRMAIREALTRLLGEGLVSLGEKGGYFVRVLSASDVHEIKELREILELGALRLAIHKIDEKSIQKLEKICDDFSIMTRNEYYNGALEADMKFHESLIEMAGNKKLQQLYQSSHIPLFHQRLGQTQQSINDYALTDNEHRQIVKALKIKNLKLAQETLSKHFARGEAIALEID
jgi:DNA-binding GntR family transcriptional regulator